MYQRILVAVDRSATSNVAFEQAIKLAKNQEALLCVLHVLEDYVPKMEGIVVELYEESIMNEAHDFLQSFEKTAKKNNVPVETCLRKLSYGMREIADKINEVVSEWKADLLVLGTHGRRGVRRVLIGSVAEEVLRTANVPILLIRSKE